MRISDRSPQLSTYIVTKEETIGIVWRYEEGGDCYYMFIETLGDDLLALSDKKGSTSTKVKQSSLPSQYQYSNTCGDIIILRIG